MIGRNLLTGCRLLAATGFLGFGLNVRLDAQSTNAARLFSTNQLNTPHFWRAVEAFNGPVTVLAFGDSMSDPGRSIQRELFARLQTKLGRSGFAISGMWWFPAEKVVYNRSDFWGIHAKLGPGEYVEWSLPQTLPCTRLGLYWVAHSGGGAFTLSVSTNGQPWSAPVLTLDGYAAIKEGRYTNFALPRQNYRLRADGLSGTNILFGPAFLDTTSTGLHVAYMTCGGVNLKEIFSYPTNVLYPLLQALNPHLVVYHMKELADIGEVTFSNRLHDLEAMWRAGVTNGDVVYLGTPYDYRDQLGEFTGRENTILRAAAVREGRAYLDCMTPCVSYDAMTNNGYFAYPTDVHPNTACNQFLTDVIWPQLGFSALRTDRRPPVQTHE